MADGVLGGWVLGTVYSAHTGFPITITSPNNANVGARTARGNHYRQLHIVDQSIDHWFGTDPSATPCGTGGDNGVCAYGQELPNTFGTAGIATERAPSFQNVDLALSKRFALSETRYFELRGDFFNAFNNVSFAPPSNSTSSATFGFINGTNTAPRNIQLGVKFFF